MVKGLQARRALGGAGLVATALLVLATPASAAPVANYGALQAAFTNPSSVSGLATLTADISQGVATGLTLTAGGTLAVDLNGNDLTTGGIVLAAGSALTVTDSTGTPGRLTVAATTVAGINTTGATLIIEGQAQVDARTTGPAAAGIGGLRTAGGTVVIRGDATVFALGGQFSSAIGGGDSGTGGDITIGGNAIVTANADDGAGIGGGDYSDGGTTRITGNANVTATSDSGAGIGGGYYGGSGGTVTIDGNATVTATSTGRGAGIGGGQANTTNTPSVGGNGGTVTVGGTAKVTATGAYYGAGIGGGLRGSGGSLTIDGGVVTAINGAQSSTSSVGPGALGTSFGTLAVDAPGVLVIPAPAALRVPPAGTVTGDGYLRGGDTPGIVGNNGAIQLPTANVDWATLGVLPNNFLVTFDANGGDIATVARAASTEVRVFATSFAAGARPLPPEPTRARHTFLEWNTSPDGTGEAVDIGQDTALSSDLTLYAQWAVVGTPPTDPPGESPGGGEPGGENPGGAEPPSDGDASTDVDALAGTGASRLLEPVSAGILLIVAGVTSFVVTRRRHRRPTAGH
ncbi:MAG: InlB B-repeat-containing protein [Actinophytocola sp.]|uniref:InlB B-repeat-containing protein n=1 Tax=Actinophytocola sp. TaxID=1872138 RepID=UPI003C78B14F